MRTVFEERAAEARSIERHIRHGTGKIAIGNFGKVAKVLWPFKTAAHIAAIAKTNERTAARWLAGEFDPPICVVEAIIHETFKHD